MHSFKAVLLSFFLPSIALCVPTKRAQCSHHLTSVGHFANHAVYTFDGDALPAGLHANTDTVGGSPFSRTHDPALVTVSNGYLNLKVPGGQTSSPIHCAGVNTVAQDILYASVRTKAILSAVPGTVQSSFFYKSDNAEIDLEYLSDPSSLTHHARQPALHYTNHATTSITADGVDPGHSLQEYRVDWVPGRTSFYGDGALQHEIAEGVPTVPGTWIWNHWSNGDKGFSMGPPKEDAVFKIREIEMFYNTSADSC